jgi:uncharacterized membrane protein
MSEPAPALRRLASWLAFGYPLIAHVAIASDSLAFTIGAVALLGFVMLLPGLASGSAGAWIALPIVALGCWWLSTTPIPVLPLFVAPVLVPAFMTWVFGRTLRRGRTPLIEQLIRALHSEVDPPPDPEVWPYARRLTLAWTVLFATISSLNFLLAALAEPDGLLLAGGIRPPITVPLEWWSWFANLIGYLLVAAFFLIEYAYRSRRFPQQPYRNMFDFIRRMLAALPGLVERART